MAAQLSRHEARLDKLATTDIVQDIDTNGLKSSIHLTDIWLQDLEHHDLAPSLPLAEAGLDCQMCGITFRHLYTLCRHELHTHGIVPPAGPTIDAVNGKPVCRYCGETFISWQNMNHHIQNFACPALIHPMRRRNSFWHIVDNFLPITTKVTYDHFDRTVSSATSSPTGASFVVSGRLDSTYGQRSP